MEFPELGRHCAAQTCSRLDFLPFECDACHQIYCKDHGPYEAHNCQASYTKDARVPVCPMCDQPVPVNRGEDPNIKMNVHIQNDCKSEKAKKISNRCSVPGCKKKELVPVTCSTCQKNFCLKHRFETDHNCQGHPSRLGGGTKRDSSKLVAGGGQKPGKIGGGGGGGGRGGRVGAPQKTSMSTIGAELNRERMARQKNRTAGTRGASVKPPNQQSPPHLQPNNIAEDEALALAMAASMTDSTPLPHPPLPSSSSPSSSHQPSAAAQPKRNTTTLEEDEALARAIAASLNDKDTPRPKPKPVARDSSKRKSSDKNDTCNIS